MTLEVLCYNMTISTWGSNLIGMEATRQNVLEVPKEEKLHLV